MTWRSLDYDESTTAALCRFSNHDSEGNIATAIIIADKLTLCSGCVWWIIDGSVDVLYLFYTSVPICDCSRLLLNDLIVPFYAPSENVIQKGVPSGRHIPAHVKLRCLDLR